MKKVSWLTEKNIWLLLLFVHGHVFFLFWMENYQLVYLINVTNPKLPVKEKHQVSNTKSTEWTSLFPQTNTTHLDKLWALILITKTQYEMEHTLF